MAYHVRVVNNGEGRYRFLCTCLAGDGVGGKKAEPMPVEMQWPHLTGLSARVAGKTHLANTHGQAV